VRCDYSGSYTELHRVANIGRGRETQKNTDGGSYTELYIQKEGERRRRVQTPEDTKSYIYRKRAKRVDATPVRAAILRKKIGKVTRC
jgi:hypothetical protein